MKYYQNDYIQRNIVGPSVYDLFCDTVQKNENCIAITYAGTQFSFADLKNLVDDMALGMLRKGFSKGSIISIVSPMIPAVLISFLAANKIGAICSLIDYKSTISQVNQKLIESGSDGLIIISRCTTRMDDIVKNTRVSKIIICSDRDYLGPMDRLRMWFYGLVLDNQEPKNLFDDELDGVDIYSWNDIINCFEDDEKLIIPMRNGKDKALFLQHSSLLENHGTEVFTNDAIISACNAIYLGYRLDRQGSVNNGVLCSMNYSYSGIFVFGYLSMLCSGMKLFINPYYNASTFVYAMFFFKPSVLIGYPSTFTSLVEQLSRTRYRNREMSFIKLIIAAGTSFVTTKRKYCEDFFMQHGCSAKISVCYGLAECLSACSFVPSNYDKNNSIGIPFPGILMKVVDPSSQRDLEAGEKGEICICGDGCLSEVLNDDVTTSRILKKHKDGRIWVHTGDIGHTDENGFFYFDYVEKRCTKINGVSVSFKQVEDIIKTVYGVFDSCVVDYCNEEGDTKLIALVVPIETYLYDNDKLNNLIKNIEIECEMMLSSISRPFEIEFRAYLPRIGSEVDYKTITKEVIEKRLNDNDEEN